MPNGRQHAAIGVLTATATSTLAVQERPGTAIAATLLGAFFGGWIGGVLPDRLEPATHPWHRDVFHSGVAGVATAVLAGKVIVPLQKHVLLRAAELRKRQLQMATGDPGRVALWLQEMGCYACLGLGIGLPVGYLSHLGTDLLTPRGIPLISRKLG